MPSTHKSEILEKLYQDFHLLQFELDYLNWSLQHYTGKKYYNWDYGFKRQQLEEIRQRIPDVYEHIKEVKQSISSMGGKVPYVYNSLTEYDEDDNDDEYNYDDYCNEYEDYYNYTE
jgi:hypothetical protein